MDVNFTCNSNVWMNLTKACPGHISPKNNKSDFSIRKEKKRKEFEMSGPLRYYTIRYHNKNVNK